MSITRIVEQIDAEITDLDRQLTVLQDAVDRLREARSTLIDATPPTAPTSARKTPPAPAKKPAPRVPDQDHPPMAPPPTVGRQQPKKCDVCDYTSPSGAGLAKHIQFNHPGVWEKRRAAQQTAAVTALEDLEREVLGDG